MNYLTLLSLLLILIACIDDTRGHRIRKYGRCTGGQVWSLCKGCSKTCDNTPTLCLALCEPGCTCPSSRPVWHHEKCIQQKRCRQCKGGQVYKQCASACDRTCEDPIPVCTKQCVERCECPQDKPILQDGVCIAEGDCPVVCPVGQVFNLCGSACDKTCGDPSPVCTEQCVARCECPSDTPIIHHGTCIRQTECCPGGQVYNECGSACTTTCSNPSPICTLQCVPRCECPSVKPVLLNYQCVAASECPVCTGGQEWSECSTFCTKTCENLDPVCPLLFACMGGCDCPANKPVFHMGNCIQQTECPNIL